MKIGILQTAYKKSEDYGKFYNVQELGLARALAKKGHEVTLFKAVDGEGRDYSESFSAGSLLVKLISVKYIGINGLLDLNLLDPSLDILIYFCDTQLIVPKVYKWCRRNNVAFYPYVGVMESHSESGLKRELMDIISGRNLKIYKKCTVFAKTPQIRDFLVGRGCTDAKLIAVGLDETVMAPSFIKGISHDISSINSSSEDSSSENSLIDGSIDGSSNKKSSSHNSSKCKLLFIGRMEKEKHPLEMLTIFESLLDSCSNADDAIQHSSSFSLTMIGDGYMYDEVATAADLIKKKYNLAEDGLRLIRKVSYSDMHLYYKEADVYINLNLVEILGMSILEAMYYGCPVVAVDAPGPRFILDDEYGIIANDFKEVTNRVGRLAHDYDSYVSMTEQAFHHVKQEFTWDA